jgi:hypothetical protein
MPAQLKTGGDASSPRAVEPSAQSAKQAETTEKTRATAIARARGRVAAPLECGQDRGLCMRLLKTLPAAFPL